MITPGQLEAMVENLIKMYQEIEDDLLTNIAKRFSVLDKVDEGSVAQWQMDKLQQLGALRKENIKTIAARSGKTLQEIERILTDAGYRALEFDERIYQMALSEGLLSASPLPLSASPGIKQLIQAAIDNTREYMNLINTTALESANQAFLDAINRVYLEGSLGVTDYNTSVRNAVRQLADQGITGATYVSQAGRMIRNHLDVAVKRCIVTSTRQATGKLKIQRAREMGSNLVEVSSHIGARPSHAVWQGKIYSMEGGTAKYPNLAASTGYGTVTGLKGANCAHDFWPFIEGLSEQTYFPVDEKENAKVYEQSQQQRKLEREIREQKRRAVTVEAAGDKEGLQKAQLALKDKEGKLKDFLNQTGRVRQRDREQILGFGHSQASKAVWAKRRNVAIQSGGYHSASIKQKTTKEAENWAKNVLGVGDVDYKGRSLDVVNNINKSLNSIFKEYPILKGFVDKIEFKDIPAVAAASLRVRNGKINASMVFSPNKISDTKSIEQMIAKEVGVGYWSPKDSLHGIIKHEAAHLAEYAATLKKHNVAKNGSDDLSIRAAFAAIKAGEISSHVQKEALNACNLQDEYRIITKHLSGYAATSSHEFLAEAVSEHRPRKLARESVRIFKDILGRY